MQDLTLAGHWVDKGKMQDLTPACKAACTACRGK
jgi:hypothetical protein